ncbi:MAG: terpene cyclase/mutase family protein [Actinobacteria bacterium]|nr:terpene cyclase/mutase family protein [Actinomycetota bacterium]
MRFAAALLASLVLVAPATGSSQYLLSRQQSDGGFAEPGDQSDPSLTAWAVLGLAATGRPPQSAAQYLAGKPYPQATDLALRILALDALGADTGALVRRLEDLRRADGRIGTLVNSTIWGVLALRATGRPAGTSVRYLLRQQRPHGGWSWYPRGLADSNDTAAAVQALRAAGVSARARPIQRALRYLRMLQGRDGGFPLVPGRSSDAQSTAWSVQAFIAAGVAPGHAPFRYLAALRQPDGSYRYSHRYAITPVWVTAQVDMALARRPLP